MTERIDAHHHFWQFSQPFDYGWMDAPELAPIRRDYLPADLRPHLDGCRIDRSVFVQTQHNLEETRWVLGMCEQNPWLAGVVGWVDLASPECESQLLDLKQHPQFVGVRHVTQDEPDDDFIIRDEVVRGLKVLQQHEVPFDLLFYVKHLRHAATLGRELPGLPMVIDHLAKPQIKRQSIDDWLPSFIGASKFPNIYCKLSGMVTEADWQDWSPSDLRPYVEAALEHFGPGRCMYGSDWPVCELAAGYDRVHDALGECLEGLSPSEREAIYGGTAIDFYQLNAGVRDDVTERES